MINKIMIAFFVGLFLVISVSATTYYVDYKSGSDSNNGLASEHAFKHAPGDPFATGNLSNVNLQPGDVVKFKGGVIYPEPVYVNWSGILGNNIIYDGNDDGSWGSGKAIIDLQDQFNQAFVTGSSKAFITVLSFDIMHSRNPLNGGQPGIIRFDHGEHNWVIRNNVFSKSQNWQSRCEDHVFVDNPAIKTTVEHGGAHDILVERNEFFALGRTIINLRNACNVTVKENDFGGINRGNETGWFSVALRIEVESHDIIIQDNKFHDGWQYGGDEAPDELCHANDYIHSYYSNNVPIGGPGPYNIMVERNVFVVDKYFNYDYGTAFISLDINSHLFTIRNNLFVNMPGNVIIGISHGTRDINIYNNDIIMRKHKIKGWLPELQVAADAGDNINIINNIFWSDINFESGFLIYMHKTSYHGKIDYNYYYHTPGKKGKIFHIDGIGGMDFSEWQSLGYDAHGGYGDPKFVYMPDDPGVSSKGDYRLQDGSPLIDAGMNLAHTGFSGDLLGNQRPGTTAWDIGAYEHIKDHNQHNQADTVNNGSKLKK